MADATLIKTIILAAPRERVWEFLTDKEKLGTWFHPADANLAEGEDYGLVRDGKKLCWGKVVEMAPPRRLVMTFTVKPLGGVMTTVSWTLDDVPGGTLLTMEHAGLDAAGAEFGLIQALDAGWDVHLGDLRKAV